MAPCQSLASKEVLRSDVTTVIFNSYQVRDGFGNWYGLTSVEFDDL